MVGAVGDPAWAVVATGAAVGCLEVSVACWVDVGPSSMI